MHAPVLPPASDARAPAVAAPVMVRTAGLVRRFGERTALQGVSLEIPAGERLALLGPNGSGKSTLLRILATLIRPSEGSASVDGLDVVSDAAAVRHRLGVAFQSPSLDGKLTVLENLRHQGWLYSLRGRTLRERIAGVLSDFHLTERGKDPVETLSGGLKRRVELAKTLLHQPRLLLLDEPSTGLDPAARIEFWNVLGAYQRAHGLTVIVATHLLEEADACGRVALLHGGKLVALDGPEALKTRVGGQVIKLESAAPEALRGRMREQFGVEGTAANGHVRLAPGLGLEVANRVMLALPESVSAVRFGRPSLEDVFLALTGQSIEPGAKEQP